ncbi:MULTISPECIES: NADP-dependent oxidoreductase [Bradyrhizobium]|uniref:NADP-dependent oxidoreductase n=1 Tax=Bradyrhizobium TaxID=374 RepID=UPI00155DF93A|nr:MULTISPECIES: NADP-dependent oxidoreductase [Bradyrhizobium]MDD1520761.1 alcohol dehydrogenase [Bradyrhizobium sp. WBAH30]MDD1545812.1 alcohol dehydrogenase [Bradyrhizobium sp. WBAH41]MDD1558927.1 alcohol dehydrogenase [Bradyrhizobium sp. WBAH23]MDD1566423.1 alcohol dehydrogenase [Bradyrhizobium sp. WBAH33]MDD1592016.1 alcohol dehydrogenase [Bradyrhizobium sp. WBAH42]
MKRVQYDRYGGPEEMYMGDFKLPELGPNDVRVVVRAAAINPFDWKLRRGAMKLFMNRSFPKGMGTDFAGVIEAVGRDVTNVSVGDEVLGTVDFKKSGAFAEKVVLESSLVAMKSPQLTFSEAACLPIPAMTAWAAIIDRARVRAGSSIFVNGCLGAVGSSAVQLAIAYGARVAGTSSPASMRKADAAGVHPIYAYSDKNAYVRGENFDAVFDTLGTLSVSDGLSMLKPDGVFVDINPTPRRLARGLLSRRYKLAFATMGIKHLSAIAELANKGALKLAVGIEAPFDDAVRTLAQTEAGPRISGKVVLTMNA